MRRLVEDGENINKPSRSGDTVHRARLDHPLNIQFLLDLRADVNGRNELGLTMLHRFGLLRDSKRLLDRMRRPDVDINARQADGATILHIVVVWDSQERDDVLEALRSRQDLDVNYMDNSGHTALTMTIHWGKSLATLILITCPRFRFNRAGWEGENPLTNAARQCWSEILMDFLRTIDNIDEFIDQDGAALNCH